MPAGKTGDDHAAPVNPDTRVRSRDEVSVAPAAETAFQRPLYPDTVAHADLAGQFHAAIAPVGVLRIELRGTRKKDGDPLASKSPGA